ncbi:IS3 family transposase [Schaalia hyovaginalis]|uniref:IS3 family transposase n=1 Tax=Schaalia hyovaginalis TaxID=29316 RepID=UPI0038B32DAF
MREHVPEFFTSWGYRAARSRPDAARARSDKVLVNVIKRVHADNYGVYRICKMWHAMQREGWDAGRDRVARLMKVAGLSQMRRGSSPRACSMVCVSPSLEGLSREC